MKIALGCDAHGFELKEHMKAHLCATGHGVVDCGCENAMPDDRIAAYCDGVCVLVSGGEADFGVLLCQSGGYMTIRANKWPGVRAVTALSAWSVVHDRGASNANVLCLAAKEADPAAVCAWVDAFVAAPYEPLERRERRLADLDRFMPPAD